MALRHLTDAEADTILQVLKEGRTLREITSNVKWPKLTSREALGRRCASHPDWGREVATLLEQNAKAAYLRRGAHKRNKTHCHRGHPLYGDNLYTYRNGGQRKCKACTLLNFANPPMPTEEQIRNVTAALNGGQNLNLICTGKRDGKKIGPRILGQNKLMLYRRHNPEFERFVLSVNARTLSRAQQRRHDPALFQTNTQREEKNDYHQIASMVPASLPRDVRDDIIQSIFIALLEGSLRRDQVKERVRRFVTAHNREADKHGVGKYGLISLDTPIYEDGATTLADRATRSIWDEVPM